MPIVTGDTETNPKYPAPCVPLDPLYPTEPVYPAPVDPVNPSDPLYPTSVLADPV